MFGNIKREEVKSMIDVALEMQKLDNLIKTHTVDPLKYSKKEEPVEHWVTVFVKPMLLGYHKIEFENDKEWMSDLEVKNVDVYKKQIDALKEYGNPFETENGYIYSSVISITWGHHYPHKIDYMSLLSEAFISKKYKAVTCKCPCCGENALYIKDDGAHKIKCEKCNLKERSNES